MLTEIDLQSTFFFRNPEKKWSEKLAHVYFLANKIDDDGATYYLAALRENKKLTDKSILSGK